MPVGTQKVKQQPLKDSEKAVRDINQLILNRQRKAEMQRHTKPAPAKSMTTEYFEGVKIV